MSALSPEQIAAVRTLQAVGAEFHAEIVIIGAIAYRIWIRDSYRQTYDVDVAVAVDLDDFARLSERLREEGWKQDSRRENRWLTPEGERLDLVPAGPGLRERRQLDWPASGIRMSLVGFDHVFADAVQYPITPDLALKVIPLPVLVLLKIVAYLDNPHQRQKDVQDVAWLLQRYEPEDDVRFGADVLDAGLEYDTVPGYLIGKEVAALCSKEEVILVATFIAQLKDDESPPFRIFSRALGGDIEERGPSMASAFVQAFELGFRPYRHN